MTASDASLDRKAESGAKWTVLGYGASQLVRMGSNLVLTRLLVPEYFGTMLIVNTVILGVQLFTDIGIVPSVVQNARGDEPDFLNTAWTIQVGRGLLLWLAICAIALPTSTFYDDRELVLLLPVAGLTAVFQGFNSSKMASYRRHVRIKALTVLIMVEQLISTVVMIAWALVSPTVWSLTVGSVVAAFCVMVFSHAGLEGLPNRLRFEKTAALELVRFGRWIFLSTLLTYLVGYSDRLIVSKLMPRDVAGVYGIAAMLAILPTAPIGKIAADVGFPVLSRIHGDGGSIEAAFRSFRAPLNAIGGWAVAGLVAGAPIGVELLWTEPYWDAGWMTQILMLGIWTGTVLVSSNTSALLALGHPRMHATASLAKLVGMAVLIPLGYLHYQLPGLLWGFSGSQICMYLVSTWAVASLGLHDWKKDLGLSLRVLVSGLAGFFVGDFLVDAGAPRIVAALALAVVVTLLWVPLLRPLVAKVRRGQSPFAIAAEAPA